MKNQRYGYFGGKKYLFTHYNPNKHEAWSDDFPILMHDGNIIYGWWIPYDSIKWE